MFFQLFFSLGQPGVDCHVTHETNCAVIQLLFLTNQVSVYNFCFVLHYVSSKCLSIFCFLLETVSHFRVLLLIVKCIAALILCLSSFHS